MTYLTFDAKLQKGMTVKEITSIPLGYGNLVTAFNSGDFVTAFDSGVQAQNSPQLSIYIAGTSTTNYITKSINPVYLHDFHITPDQCGLATTQQNGISQTHALILEDYAVTQAYKNKKKREHFESREQKRNAIFEKPNKKSRKRYFEHETTTEHINNKSIDPFLLTSPFPNSSDNHTSTSQTSNGLPDDIFNEDIETIEEQMPL